MEQMSRCQVSYFRTDGWPSYRKVLPPTLHSVSKGGTLQIEWHNLNFRTRLKRLQQLLRASTVVGLFTALRVEDEKNSVDCAVDRSWLVLYPHRVISKLIPHSKFNFASVS